MNGDALEVGDDEVARDFLAASAVHQTANVFHALRVGFAKVFAGALVLGEQRLGPEEINEAPVAGEFLHRLFVAGNVAALLAEDVEEGVPERFRLGFLAGFVAPFLGEGNGAVFDFVPGKRHEGRLGKRMGAVNAFTRNYTEDYFATRGDGRASFPKAIAGRPREEPARVFHKRISLLSRYLAASTCLHPAAGWKALPSSASKGA